MANPTRLLVLCQLVEGEKSVTELQSGVTISQSALSQHLSVLRQLNIVTSRRVAQSILYRLRSSAAIGVMEVVYQEFCEPAPGKKAKTAGAKRAVAAK